MPLHDAARIAASLILFSFAFIALHKEAES
jgi:hypothetical protein